MRWNVPNFEAIEPQKSYYFFRWFIGMLACALICIGILLITKPLDISVADRSAIQSGMVTFGLGLLIAWILQIAIVFTSNLQRSHSIEQYDKAIKLWKIWAKKKLAVVGFSSYFPDEATYNSNIYQR